MGLFRQDISGLKCTWSVAQLEKEHLALMELSDSVLGMTLSNLLPWYHENEDVLRSAWQRNIIILRGVHALSMGLVTRPIRGLLYALSPSLGKVLTMALHNNFRNAHFDTHACTLIYRQRDISSIDKDLKAIMGGFAFPQLHLEGAEATQMAFHLCSVAKHSLSEVRDLFQDIYHSSTISWLFPALQIFRRNHLFFTFDKFLQPEYRNDDFELKCRNLVIASCLIASFIGDKHYEAEITMLESPSLSKTWKRFPLNLGPVPKLVPEHIILTAAVHHAIHLHHLMRLLGPVVSNHPSTLAHFMEKSHWLTSGKLRHQLSNSRKLYGGYPLDILQQMEILLTAMNDMVNFNEVSRHLNMIRRLVEILQVQISVHITLLKKDIMLCHLGVALNELHDGGKAYKLSIFVSPLLSMISYLSNKWSMGSRYTIEQTQMHGWGAR